MNSVVKKSYPLQRLINWYWGNLEYKYSNCGFRYLNKLNAFGAILISKGITELTHKEFAVLVKERVPFRGIKRKRSYCAWCARARIR